MADGFEIKHTNAVKNDNRLSNLELVTHKKVYWISSKLGVIGAQESALDMFARRTGSSWGERVDGSCGR